MQKPSSISNSAQKCYRCQGYDHIAYDCPNRRVVTIRKEVIEEKDEEVNQEGGEIEEFTEYADEEEDLVIRRSLNVIQENEEAWLRDNIFQTKCTSHGKLCNVIINSVSCINLVAEEMVNKLNLKTRPHPQPYKIQWFQKGNVLKVTKKCMVSFSIGKNYKGKIWCDVVPLDACHLLLGRPWQFDRNVSHNGFKNTHSFIKDGIWIVLAPMKP